MLTRAHPNVVVVALAAKLARIAWVVLHKQQDFDRQALVAPLIVKNSGQTNAARSRWLREVK